MRVFHALPRDGSDRSFEWVTGLPLGGAAAFAKLADSGARALDLGFVLVGKNRPSKNAGARKPCAGPQSLRLAAGAGLARRF